MSKATLRFKDGVVWFNPHPDLIHALAVGAKLYFERFRRPMTITSGSDSTHSATSRHYPQEATNWHTAAADVRVWGMTPAQRTEFVQAWAKVVNAQGHRFDIIDEENHIHIEWDPR